MQTVARRPLDSIADEIQSLAADIEVARCRWLGLIAEFDEREGWAPEGFANCAAWVAYRCALSPMAAREYVRVARRLRELPQIREAFATAVLTYSKVRALTRIENIEDEDELVELARNATAAQLETMIGKYGAVLRATAETAFAERFFSWTIDDDGGYRFRGRLPAEIGALVAKALETAREELGADVSAETLDSPGARNADALALIAERALSADETGSTGGDRYQVVVHLEPAALAGDIAARCELDGGAPVAPETARRLTCDAALVGIVEQDGAPLSVGRKTRSIPPALRRALRSRDRGCQFPGCTHTRHVDAHHIHHWADGGHTDIANLVQLCRHHHRLVHEGGFTVEGAVGALVFRAPNGRRLGLPPRERRVACQPLTRVSAEAPLQANYDRMNLANCVDALLQFAPPPSSGPPAPPG